MVRICPALGCVCGTDVHSGQGGHRGRELQPCDRHPHGGRAGDGVGHGVRDEHAGRTYGHQQEELAVSDPLGSGDGGIVAVLLPRAADRGDVEGRADR